MPVTFAATARFCPVQLGPLARQTSGTPAPVEVSRTRVARTATSCRAAGAGVAGVAVGAVQIGVVSAVPS